MSTIEQSINQARMRIRTGFNPEGIRKPNPEISLQKPLVITPEFFSRKLDQLKNITKVITIEEIREKRLLVAENPSLDPKSEKAPDTNTILTEIQNPHKDILDKLANVNRSLRNAYRRRRSGCRCHDKENMETQGCRSRYCEKKRKRTKLPAQQQAPRRTNIVAIGSLRRLNASPGESKKAAA